jgi:hypothetical protein
MAWRVGDADDVLAFFLHITAIPWTYRSTDSLDCVRLVADSILLIHPSHGISLFLDPHADRVVTLDCLQLQVLHRPRQMKQENRHGVLYHLERSHEVLSRESYHIRLPSLSP